MDGSSLQSDWGSRSRSLVRDSHHSTSSSLGRSRSRSRSHSRTRTTGSDAASRVGVGTPALRASSSRDDSEARRSPPNNISPPTQASEPSARHPRQPSSSEFASIPHHDAYYHDPTGSNTGVVGHGSSNARDGRVSAISDGGSIVSGDSDRSSPRKGWRGMFKNSRDHDRRSSSQERPGEARVHIAANEPTTDLRTIRANRRRETEAMRFAREEAARIEDENAARAACARTSSGSSYYSVSSGRGKWAGIAIRLDDFDDEEDDYEPPGRKYSNDDTWSTNLIVPDDDDDDEPEPYAAEDVSSHGRVTVMESMTLDPEPTSLRRDNNLERVRGEVGTVASVAERRVTRVQKGRGTRPGSEAMKNGSSYRQPLMAGTVPFYPGDLILRSGHGIDNGSRVGDGGNGLARNSSSRRSRDFGGVSPGGSSVGSWSSSSSSSSSSSPSMSSLAALRSVKYASHRTLSRGSSSIAPSLSPMQEVEEGSVGSPSSGDEPRARGSSWGGFGEPPRVRKRSPPTVVRDDSDVAGDAYSGSWRSGGSPPEDGPKSPASHLEATRKREAAEKKQEERRAKQMAERGAESKHGDGSPGREDDDMSIVAGELSAEGSKISGSFDDDMSIANTDMESAVSNTPVASRREDVDAGVKTSDLSGGQRMQYTRMPPLDDISISSLSESSSRIDIPDLPALRSMRRVVHNENGGVARIPRYSGSDSDLDGETRITAPSGSTYPRRNIRIGHRRRASDGASSDGYGVSIKFLDDDADTVTTDYESLPSSTLANANGGDSYIWSTEPASSSRKSAASGFASDDDVACFSGAKTAVRSTCFPLGEEDVTGAQQEKQQHDRTPSTQPVVLSSSGDVTPPPVVEAKPSSQADVGTLSTEDTSGKESLSSLLAEQLPELPEQQPLKEEHASVPHTSTEVSSLESSEGAASPQLSPPQMQQLSQKLVKLQQAQEEDHYRQQPEDGPVSQPGPLKMMLSHLSQKLGKMHPFASKQEVGGTSVQHEQSEDLSKTGKSTTSIPPEMEAIPKAESEGSSPELTPGKLEDRQTFPTDSLDAISPSSAAVAAAGAATAAATVLAAVSVQEPHAAPVATVQDSQVPFAAAVKKPQVATVAAFKDTQTTCSPVKQHVSGVSGSQDQPEAGEVCAGPKEEGGGSVTPREDYEKHSPFRSPPQLEQLSHRLGDRHRYQQVNPALGAKCDPENEERVAEEQRDGPEEKDGEVEGKPEDAEVSKEDEQPETDPERKKQEPEDEREQGMIGVIIPSPVQVTASSPELVPQAVVDEPRQQINEVPRASEQGSPEGVQALPLQPLKDMTPPVLCQASSSPEQVGSPSLEIRAEDSLSVTPESRGHDAIMQLETPGPSPASNENPGDQAHQMPVALSKVEEESQQADSSESSSLAGLRLDPQPEAFSAMQLLAPSPEEDPAAAHLLLQLPTPQQGMASSLPHTVSPEDRMQEDELSDDATSRGTPPPELETSEVASTLQSQEMKQHVASRTSKLQALQSGEELQALNGGQLVEVQQEAVRVVESVGRRPLPASTQEQQGIVMSQGEQQAPWWASLGNTDADEEARVAMRLAIAAVQEDERAVARAVATAKAVAVNAGESVEGVKGGVGHKNGDHAAGKGHGPKASHMPLENCTVMTSREQDEVRRWLSEGVTVKKWTSGGRTIKRKLRLEKAENQASKPNGSGVSKEGDSGSKTFGAGMDWKDWSNGGKGEEGAYGGVGEDGPWRLVLKSGKTKSGEVVHHLVHLKEVVEDKADKSATLMFEGEGRVKVLFPMQQPAVRFFRQVVENRRNRERISETAKAVLVAFEKGAVARAASAVAQDAACRWRRDSDLGQLGDACKEGDIIEGQPNRSPLAATHVADAGIAYPELDALLRELTRFDYCLTAQPIEMMMESAIEEDAMRCFEGDVWRVLTVLKAVVSCRGAKDAAKFCRQLKAHPQVKAVMWKEPSASSGLVEGQDFPITQAFVHLARSDHVALIELRQEKFLSTVGVDYKSEEWARALRVPVTAKEQSLRFDRLRTPIKQRMISLVRTNFMGLWTILPQLLLATAQVDEATALLKKNLEITQTQLTSRTRLGEDEELEKAKAAVASASAMSELAMLHQSQGDVSRAEELFRSALDTRTRVFGPDHPCVALSASSLASVLREQGRRAEATSVLVDHMNMSMGDAVVLAATSSSSLPAGPASPRTRKQENQAITPVSKVAGPTPVLLPETSETSAPLPPDAGAGSPDAKSSSLPAVCYSPVTSLGPSVAATTVNSARHDTGDVLNAETGNGAETPCRPTTQSLFPSPPIADEMEEKPHPVPQEELRLGSPDAPGITASSSSGSMALTPDSETMILAITADHARDSSVVSGNSGGNIEGDGEMGEVGYDLIGGDSKGDGVADGGSKVDNIVDGGSEGDEIIDSDSKVDSIVDGGSSAGVDEDGDGDGASSYSSADGTTRDLVIAPVPDSGRGSDKVGIDTVSALAAAVTAVSAGRSAQTANVASACASASAAVPSTPRGSRRLAIESSLEGLSAVADSKGRNGELVDARQMGDSEMLENHWEMAHSVAVASLNNLAVLLSEQGDAVQAEGFHRRALRAREVIHGPDHPDMPLLLSNLAGTLYVQGKDDEAEPLHERALQLREALLGSTHPDVATSLEFLVRMAMRRGRLFSEMESLVKRLVEAREACLTKSSAPPPVEGRRQVGSVMSALAVSLRKQPREQAARAFHLFRRVFLSDEKILGSYHALVAEDVVNLAEVMSAQGKLPQAEELHRRALKIRQYTLGEDHPSTIASLRHLGHALRDQGKTQAGQLLIRRAGEMQSKTRGSARQAPPPLHPYHPELHDGGSLFDEKDDGEDEDGTATLAIAGAAGDRSQAQPQTGHYWSETGRQVKLENPQRGRSAKNTIPTVRHERGVSVDGGGVHAQGQPRRFGPGHPRRRRVASMVGLPLGCLSDD